MLFSQVGFYDEVIAVLVDADSVSIQLSNTVCAINTNRGIKRILFILLYVKLVITLHQISDFFAEWNLRFCAFCRRENNLVDKAAIRHCRHSAYF